MIEIQLPNFTISRDSRPYFVAEIGLNHNRNLEVGKRTIQSAKKAGAHAVKFQSYKTEDFIESSIEESKFLFDIFKKYELDEEFHYQFQKTATEEGLDFFSTPLDTGSIALLQKLKVPLLKIASGDIVNRELLSQSLKTGLPLFVSTGAAKPYEIVRALDFFQEQGFSQLVLFHCVSLYPTAPEKANLRTISYFLETTPYPIGFSDHTAGALAASVAIGLGATVIEKHFTLDQKLDGPDHTISATPEIFANMVEMGNQSYEMRGEYKIKRQPEEVNGWFWGRRSLYSTTKGLMAKRPALHLKDSQYREAWEWKEN